MASSPDHSKKSSGRVPKRSHRATLSAQKTEVSINIYDLLPPGKLSNLLWTLGSALLHSGVVVNDREYAYGGHDHPFLSGVYWTKPRTEPPGGTFRHSILHGFTIRSEEEIAEVIKSVSDAYLGREYNLLSRNCNHFTSALCEALTQKPAPAWLNRAASIGVAMPCVVPREWIEPPDHETAEGELLEGEESEDEARENGGRDEDLDEDNDERSRMLAHQKSRRRSSVARERAVRASAKRDTSGRAMPLSERAPEPRDADEERS